ncbi:MAG: redox-sensing transcriptional repressor Rex [Lachnospirales bacterium]|nr:redox-sensing transcriptional repressor Rex [Clostridiales bacterium]
MDKKVSLAVIKRLPRYYRFLGDLLDNGIKRISSKELSEKMDVTASQIRQDLNNFGCFGQQGYGYNVELLFEEIKEILGLNKTYNLVILGAGKIGQALLNYSKFEKRGFNFIGIFDTNPNIIGTKIRDLDVKDIKELENFIKLNNVDIAILAVPGTNAYDLYKDVVSYGIKGIWNFSNTELKKEDGVIVENVHLTDSLMTLAYKFNSNNFIEE